MKIHLVPEVASGLGEDTFWTWFKREFPNSEFISRKSKVGFNDVILQYSTMGKSAYPDNTICLLWELYPEMRIILKSNIWDGRIARIAESAKYSNKLTTTSKIMTDYYKNYGNIDVLPIGVDTEIFKPLKNIDELKNKYHIPLKTKIGIWAGTTHEMKGFDKFLKYKISHPDIFWIIIWKWSRESSPLRDKNCLNFTQIPQTQMNELFNCGDFFLSTSRLRPFYMTEWEALASNLEFIILDGIKKDFIPNKNPRNQIFKYGWDRVSAKKKWLKYINLVSQQKTLIMFVRFQIYKTLDELTKIRSIVKDGLKKLLYKVNPIYKKVSILSGKIDNLEKMVANLSANFDIVSSEDIVKYSGKNIDLNKKLDNIIDRLDDLHKTRGSVLNDRINSIAESINLIEKKIINR